MPKRKKASNEEPELKFLFSYANIDVSVDPEMYSEDEKDRIEQIVSTCSKHIDIDKTYVDYEGTPYEKTFMTEDGWKHFCKLVRKTKFGNKCNRAQSAALQENYTLMILCYLYQILEDFEYDCAGICLEIKDKSRFMVQIFNDTAKQAKYVGKWQSWKHDKKSKALI